MLPTKSILAHRRGEERTVRNIREIPLLWKNVFQHDINLTQIFQKSNFKLTCGATDDPALEPFSESSNTTLIDLSQF